MPYHIISQVNGGADYLSNLINDQIIQIIVQASKFQTLITTNFILCFSNLQPGNRTPPEDHECCRALGIQ